MALQIPTTIIYSGNRKVVARFVAEVLQALRNGYVSITITAQEKYEDCSVSIAIDMSLVDTVENVALSFSKLHTNTLQKNTQVGMSL